MFYQYDQLNRIKNANRVTNSNNNNYASNRIENYEFDANGNITTLQRTRMNGNVANVAQRIDNLSYNYNTTDNKLAYIADNASNASDTDDLKNQAANNYTYDEIGNLTQDLEGKNKQVFWTAYGKVSKVIKATNDSILYRYDATGQRISKTFKDKTTFYVRDASGNVMATYEQTTTTTTVKEINIYGSSRVGTYNGKSERNKEVLGNKNYELSNHLGNVLVTITDNKFIAPPSGAGGLGVFVAKVNSTTDYYPFGMAITERTWQSKEYRYGFNTQEKDFDIDESGNHTTAEFWEYDSRSGRRWNTDPVVKEYESPYSCIANNPIWFTDHLGNDTLFYSKDSKRVRTNPALPDVWEPIADRVIKSNTPHVYLYAHEAGKIEKDGKNYVELWSKFSMRGHDNLMQGTDGDLKNDFYSKLYKYLQKHDVRSWTGDQLRSASSLGDVVWKGIEFFTSGKDKQGLLDLAYSDFFKPDHNSDGVTNKLYLISGKYANANEAANFAIGFAYGHANYSGISPAIYADMWSILSDGTLDDAHENSILKRGLYWGYIEHDIHRNQQILQRLHTSDANAELLEYHEKRITKCTTLLNSFINGKIH